MKKIFSISILFLFFSCSKNEPLPSIIDEPEENNTAAIAAKLAKDEKIRIIVKGHIHTDILMKEVLKREYNLLGKTRLSHIWHMTLDKEDKPLIITDGALNVLPNVKTKMHILKNVINFSNRIGIERPKIAVLSATEEVLDSVPSSIEAEEITGLNIKTPEQAIKACEWISDSYPEITPLITLDKEGVAVSFDNNTKIIKSFEVDVVDTIGAGDAFIAGLAISIAEGNNFIDACNFANATAALSVTKQGAQTSMPNRNTVEKFLEI